MLVAQKVTAGVYKGVTTHELDELAAETAASMTAKHPDYSTLAARIAVSNLHKSTNKSFSETVKLMRGYVNERNGKDSPLVSESFYNFVMEHANRLDSKIIYDRDFHYDYFGFKIDNIYDTLKQCTTISAGGIGLSAHNIRATRHSSVTM